MNLQPSVLAGIVIAIAVMSSCAALAVAGRSLNRLQRRAWANGNRDADPISTEGRDGVGVAATEKMPIRQPVRAR